MKPNSFSMFIARVTYLSNVQNPSSLYPLLSTTVYHAANIDQVQFVNSTMDVSYQ